MKGCEPGKVICERSVAFLGRSGSESSAAARDESTSSEIRIEVVERSFSIGGCTGEDYMTCWAIGRGNSVELGWIGRLRAAVSTCSFWVYDIMFFLGLRHYFYSQPLVRAILAASMRLLAPSLLMASER